MHIPTYLNRSDAALPEARDEPMRFVVAENGIFLERRSPMFSTSIRVNRQDLGLAFHDEYCRLTCGRIPRAMHRAMLSFFTCAHALHEGEAALVLLYHPQRRVFRWHCPEQVVEQYWTWSGWRAGDLIEYENPLTLPDGYVNFGDAHLHVGSPTPSAVDVRDDQDGLHIIVGTIQSAPTYHVTFVMDGARFRIAPESVFEDPYCVPFRRTPGAWLNRIHVRWVQTGQFQTHSGMDHGSFEA
jgi:hypothetical protein